MTPWEQFRQDFKGKRVLIMGLGLQGRGAGDAKVFAEAGAKVTVTDLKTTDHLKGSVEKLRPYAIAYRLGEHRKEDFIDTDVVIRNPDVTKSKFLDIARSHGVPIKMDSSLFAKYCNWPIIGITGTRGKTTTTMMIYQILKKHFKNKALLGGNMPGKATLELLQEVQKSTKKYKKVQKGIVVLELSSWELKGWHGEKISPHMAVFTNLYEDHLNRYESMKEYLEDKTAIFKYQDGNDFLILNRGFEGSEGFKGNGKKIYFSAEDLPKDFRLRIPGDHNRENAAAALAVGKILGFLEAEILKILKNFGGVAYRLQKVATIAGVDFINDTTSTTPIAGATALKAMTRPIILIAGGASKKLNSKPFAKEILKAIKENKVKEIIWLEGEGTSELLSAIQKFKIKNLKLKIPEIYDNFQIAIMTAYRMAKKGDAVLLSPGCASFSMFKNEFDRGEQFNKIVVNIANKLADHRQ